MPTIGQDISNRAAAESFEYALNCARQEAARDAVVKFSGRLEWLANHAAKEELSAVEIIEMLRVAAGYLHDQGLAS